MPRIELRLILGNTEPCLLVEKTQYKFDYNVNGIVLVRCKSYKTLAILTKVNISFAPYIEHMQFTTHVISVTWIVSVSCIIY